MTTPDHTLSLVELLASADRDDTGPTERPIGDRLPDEFTVVASRALGERRPT